MATESLDLFAGESTTKADYVVGTVSAVFFASQDSFYKVMLVKVSETSLDWHEDEIVVTGNFADIKDDVTYRFTGKRVEHPKYGVQFQADNYQNETPTSRAGVVAYLSGDDFPGLGKKTAEKIVDALGTNAIEAILNDSSILTPLHLSPKIVATLVSQLQTNNGMEQIIIGLNGYGFGSSLAAAIYNRYQEKTLDVIHENPYQLAEDIQGVSFKRADQIATQLGYEADRPERLQAGLLQTLADLSVSNGDTFTTAKPLHSSVIHCDSWRIRVTFDWTHKSWLINYWSWPNSKKLWVMTNESISRACTMPNGKLLSTCNGYSTLMVLVRSSMTRPFVSRFESLRSRATLFMMIHKPRRYLRLYGPKLCC